MSDKIYQDDMKDVAGGIGDKPICKYVTVDGKITEHLTHRCSFKTKTQAEQVKTTCSAQYPKRLFDIIVPM